LSTPTFFVGSRGQPSLSCRQCRWIAFISERTCKYYEDYSMYSTFLTTSTGSVLFSRSNLPKRKDLYFS
jgi:hypothetical protein